LGERRKAKGERRATNHKLGVFRARRPSPFALRLASLSLALAIGAACGKKGDPQPPVPRGPHAIADLKVEQEGLDAVLAFSYPDRLLSGLPLTDLAAIEIYRVTDPPPTLVSPAPAPSGPAPKTDEAPAAGARRTALNARLAEEAFYREAKKIDTLPIAALAQRTRGASILYRDPLGTLLASGKAPSLLGYAVVAVRRGGERSPLSNAATLAPDIPPGPPIILAVTSEESRICLEWSEPDSDDLGRRPAKVGGFFVYRRTLDEDEYGPPLNNIPIVGTSFIDAPPPFARLVYTVRATLPDKPKIEGPPAIEAGVDHRDIYPPSAPARLDALSEGKLVRLVWDPVAAGDLAGYAVYRAEGTGEFTRLTPDLVKESFFNDTTAQSGRRYRYVVKAVDTTGNESRPSPEATAEPF